MQDEFEERTKEYQAESSTTCKATGEEARQHAMKETERHFKVKCYKLSQVANPANGDEFFRLVMTIPWDKPKLHVASEEKLVLVSTAKVNRFTLAFIFYVNKFVTFYSTNYTL